MIDEMDFFCSQFLLKLQRCQLERAASSANSANFALLPLSPILVLPDNEQVDSWLLCYQNISCISNFTTVSSAAINVWKLLIISENVLENAYKL